jgi:hypothetical protein
VSDQKQTDLFHRPPVLEIERISNNGNLQTRIFCHQKHLPRIIDRAGIVERRQVAVKRRTFQPTPSGVASPCGWPPMERQVEGFYLNKQRPPMKPPRSRRDGVTEPTNPMMPPCRPPSPSCRLTCPEERWLKRG